MASWHPTGSDSGLSSGQGRYRAGSSVLPPRGLWAATKGVTVTRKLKWCFASPRRAVCSVVAGLVLMAMGAGTAYAAWVFFQGIQGTGQTTVGTATINKLQLTPYATGSTTVNPGGGDGQVAVDIGNGDTVAHTITSLGTPTISASGGCDASSITFIPATSAQATSAGYSYWGASIPANQANTGTHYLAGFVHAPNTLAMNCQNATVTVTFGTGATTT